MANSDLVKGFILGAVVISAVPLVLAAAGGRREALGRGLARAGGVLADKTREVFAELTEVAEDVAADLEAVEAENPAETVAQAEAEVKAAAAAAGGKA